ncbi:hypothetical protein MtrunA17_Chr5g0441931 [Medicago truncatula]|uniref:Transmembrane protein n=1 Tax=Medicago truncatula TaxID=3880 RepID=A0A396I1J5_MEDTR|nr:hypothetical protein MtrunA17_Chr5g0441931 [Medicago truncatula]
MVFVFIIFCFPFSLPVSSFLFSLPLPSHSLFPDRLSHGCWKSHDRNKKREHDDEAMNVRYENTTSIFEIDDLICRSRYEGGEMTAATVVMSSEMVTEVTVVECCEREGEW